MVLDDGVVQRGIYAILARFPAFSMLKAWEGIGGQEFCGVCGWNLLLCRFSEGLRAWFVRFAQGTYGHFLRLVARIEFCWASWALLMLEFLTVRVVPWSCQ